jgi:hypothetical protein
MGETWSVPIDDLLRTRGYARLGTLLERAECEAIRGLYEQPELFRSRIEMARYRFGRGEYQYFGYPLPAPVDRLRRECYTQLAPMATAWMADLRFPVEYPARLDDFLAQCHTSGQTRPTPLVLRYRAGDFNCLHQDLYGDIVFPFQVIIGLSRPDVEFTGGELLLVEQQPRAQSIGRALRVEQGEAVAITTRYRPVQGSRGYYRSNFRHGVSEVLSGERYTLGLIFHDAA